MPDKDEKKAADRSDAAAANLDFAAVSGQHHNQKEDIKFDRDELIADDGAAAAVALEKRNSPMPEKYREDQTGLGDWPVHEGRKPAAMPADQVDSLEYKLKTYGEIKPEDRALEVEGATGDAARKQFRQAVRDAGPGADMNEIQAPPSRNAQIAAEGGGAESSPVPIVNPQDTSKLAQPSLANPTLARTAAVSNEAATSAKK